jgi:putative nucleotidyltransferase with HDIG domain
VPRGSWLLVAASTASTVGVSVVIANIEAAVWIRRPGSRDLVFADLMLWGWLRRCWTERRLAQTQALYDTVTKAGLTVSVELLEGVSKRLQARDAYTHGHSRRVARHAESIARAMHLSPADVAKIRTAATVHDVGKIYTPREILNNPGLLTDREYAIVRLHASDGANMLEAAGDPEITAMVRHHHERVDGHGYPDGLRGSNIPLGARIIAVADTFDAITSNRPYRMGDSHKRALEVLSQQASSQLDSTAVAAFLSSYSSRRSVAWFAFATAVPQRIFAVLQTASSSIGASSGAITSMLPALGAASLLTLSPGLRHDTTIERSTYRQPTVTQPQPAISVIPSTNTLRYPARPTTSTPLAQPQPGRTRGRVRIPVARTPLRTPVSKKPAARTPSAPALTDPSTRTREPIAAAPTAPPRTSSPGHAPPPAKEAPQPLESPTSPPVELPSVPLPSVPLPGIPSIPIPSVSASAPEALASNTPKP